MNYKKIHIIGGPGSGKSYSAKRLSKKLEIPHYDLDNIFWNHNTTNSYGVKVEKNKRNDKLNKILLKDKYIIEGVYYSWLRKSFKLADIIIVLNTSVWIRDYRIIRRFIKRRLGIIESKKESLKDLYKLLKWNHRYDKCNLKNAIELIRSLNNDVFFCKTYEDILKIIYPKRGTI